MTALRDRLHHWLGTRADDDALRALFVVMLTATACVVAMDYRELSEAVPAPPAAIPGPAPGVTPSAEPLPEGGGGRPAPPRSPDATLRQPMAFDLRSGGRLVATGTIVPGTARTFADEIDKRGGYVKTVVLHSPGGSLGDALAMGRLIRAKGFATEVESGGYCASACPLVFAGGSERRAGAKAALGVHRAVALSADPAAPRDGMADGQRVSAQAQKYLREMGVDLGVWIHAMETPNDRLYYFRSEEMLELKLATEAGVRKPDTAAKAKT